MIENQYDIAIIGASIVGASLASRLAPHIRVLLIDNHVSEPDPFVQLKPPLTELARRSVAAYSSIPGAFDQTGSLEVARTDSEMEDLRGRGILSVNMGLDVTLVSGTEAHRLAPAFVDKVSGGLHFADDGVVDTELVAKTLQEKARAVGVHIIAAEVFCISNGVNTSSGRFSATHIVVTSWDLLPVGEAVGHACAFSSFHRPRLPSPFVIFGKVYIHNQGDRDRMSIPVPTGRSSCNTALDSAVGRAVTLLPEETGVRFARQVIATIHGEEVAQQARRYASVPITPDGLPLVGWVRERLYAAVGVGVSHAVGAGELLADMILEDMGKGRKKDAEMRRVLDPLRND